MTTKDEATIKDAMEAFTHAVDALAENHKEGLDDLRFARMGEQWPKEIETQRKVEGRPMLTINRLPSFIRQVVNDSRLNRPQISVHPVDDDADPEIAEVIGGLIRNIEYTSNADVAYDTAIENAVVSGMGFMRVKLDYAHDDSFDQDIVIERIANPFAVFFDPHSTAADSSDWSYAFLVDRMRKEDFERTYKGAKAVDWKGDLYGGVSSPWIDEETIQIAEYFKREEVIRPSVKLSSGEILDAKQYAKVKEFLDSLGIQAVAERDLKSWKVTHYLMTGAEVLEETDWIGKFIPIIPVYGDEVNVEGKRYFRSLIRDAKDPQRMFNYWRTQATELVALAPKAPYIGPKGSFATDAAKWAQANTQNYAYLEYDPVRDGNGQMLPGPQRQPFAGVAAGALQEAMNASDDMKSVMGIYDASLGARSNETSGRAILARQKEGDVGTYHFVDNLARGIRHLGRIIIDLIPQVYTGERVIRVLGKEGDEPQNVKLGAQMTGEQGEPLHREDGTPKIFDLTMGKYDLIVKTGPSFSTMREEAATQMMEMIRVWPQSAPLIGDLVAKNLDWPGADDVAERLRAMLPPQIKGQDPQVQHMQQQLQQAGAHIASLEQGKSLEVAKLQIDAHKAETDRLKVVGPAMGPAEIQALVMQTIQQVLSQPAPGQPPQPPAPPMPMPAPPMGPPGMPPQPQ